MKFLNTIIGTAEHLFRKAKFKVSQKSPEILLVVSGVTLVVGTVDACRATLKAKDILDEHEEKLELIKKCEEEHSVTEEYTEDDKKHDLVVTYSQTGMKLASIYIRPAAILACSYGCTLGLHHVLSKRNAALASAYAAVDNAFRTYRKRVQEECGDDADKRFLYGTKAGQLVQYDADETGDTKQEEVRIVDPDAVSQYAVIITEGNPIWDKDDNYVNMVIRSQQNMANARLIADGFLFLNDVLYGLGVQKTKAGQIVGWRKDSPNGDGYVELHVEDIWIPSGNPDHPYQKAKLIDFNVDGNILSSMT